MPSVRFLPLASGSKGNCSYIETAHARLLVDCGITYKRLSATLLEHGISPGSLDAICITHTHSDHISGLGRLLARHPLRVYVHERAFMPLDLELRRQGLAGGLDACDALTFSGDGFPHRDLDLLPVAVSHDAHPTTMFKFYAPDGTRLGILTDLGEYTPLLGELFSDCDLLLLESNHCTDMLRTGPYPARLKARIAGSRGHLSNRQALEFVLGLPRLPRELILGHLSDTNNTAQAASGTFTAAVSATSLPLFLERGSMNAPAAGRTCAAPTETGIPHRVLVQMTSGPLLEL